MNDYYTIITFTVVVLPAIVGLLLYKKYKGKTVKYFIWFCVYIVIIEIIGNYNLVLDKFEPLYFIKEFFKGSLFENYNWWYIIFWELATALFYAFYFYNLIKNVWFRKIIKFSTLVFVIIFLGYFMNNLDTISTQRHSFFIVSSAILILLSVLMYFIEILKSDKILTITRSMNFYIGVAILFWHLIITPLTFYDIYFNPSDMNYSIIKGLIYLGCNVFMYLTFTIALIWCKPQNT